MNEHLKTGLGLKDPRNGGFVTINYLIHEYIKNHLKVSCERVLTMDEVGLNPVITKLTISLGEDTIQEVEIRKEII